MKASELERLLHIADEVADLERRARHAEAVASTLAHDEDVVQAAAPVREAMGRAGEALGPIARELEREWVDQSPLVAEWQRAVELRETAAEAGVEADVYREEADMARRDVEAARLATRRQRELIETERRAIASVLEDSPFDVEVPPGGDDSRPEVARREALELLGVAEDAAAEAAASAVDATTRAGEARAELERIGDPATLRARLAEVRAHLPAEIELEPDAPESAAARLARAGVRVR